MKWQLDNFTAQQSLENTKICPFVGWSDCECSTGIKHLDSDWTEQLSELSRNGFHPEEENSEIYRQEFWKTLENEWLVSELYY